MARRVPVRWDEFEAAFIIGAPDSRYFVNLDTGGVEYTSFLDDETVRSRVLGRTVQPGWIEIPRPTQVDARREIEAFIGQQEPTVQLGLQKGYLERNPFIGFNKALAAFPEVRRAWAVARMAGIHRRLVAFCKANDVEIDDERFAEMVGPPRD